MDRRSRKIRKLAEFVRTSLSETMTHELNQPLRNMALRNHLQVDHRHILTEEEGERIFRLSSWNSKLNGKSMEIQVLNELVKHNERLNVNAASLFDASSITTCTPRLRERFPDL